MRPPGHARSARSCSVAPLTQRIHSHTVEIAPRGRRRERYTRPSSSDRRDPASSSRGRQAGVGVLHRGCLPRTVSRDTRGLAGGLVHVLVRVRNTCRHVVHGVGAPGAAGCRRTRVSGGRRCHARVMRHFPRHRSSPPSREGCGQPVDNVWIGGSTPPRLSTPLHSPLRRVFPPVSGCGEAGASPAFIHRMSPPSKYQCQRAKSALLHYFHTPYDVHHYYFNPLLS